MIYGVKLNMVNTNKKDFYFNFVCPFSFISFHYTRLHSYSYVSELNDCYVHFVHLFLKKIFKFEFSYKDRGYLCLKETNLFCQ